MAQTILASKAQGFEFAQEIIAKEGKEFALTVFSRHCSADREIHYWSGFLNACTGMSASDSHGTRYHMPRGRDLNPIAA